MQGMAVFKC